MKGSSAIEAPNAAAPKPRRKIAIVGCVGIPAGYGGFETLVEYLTAMLCDQYEMHVYCSSKTFKVRTQFYNGARLHYVPLRANGITSILYDILSMIHASRYADTILILGVSGCAFLPVFRHFSSANVIVNVDGVEWRRQKWGRFARYFLRISERRGVRTATTVVSDNARISDYLAHSYGVESVCIAYGGDHAIGTEGRKPDLDTMLFFQDAYAVKVCRIEPENNIDLVLEAFSRLPAHKLVVIGNWTDSRYGRCLYDKYGTKGNIRLLDPIYDRGKLDVIRRNASIYIHGHSAGGTNPSLVEAMWLGLPIVAFDVDFNRETTENKAVYFSSCDGLARLIELLTKDDIHRIAHAMREIAERRYTWQKIVDQYSAIFSI